MVHHRLLIKHTYKSITKNDNSAPSTGPSCGSPAIHHSHNLRIVSGDGFIRAAMRRRRQPNRTRPSETAKVQTGKTRGVAMIGQSSGNAGPAVSQSSSRFPSRVKMVQTHVTQSQTIPGKKIEKRQSNQPEIKLPDMSACQSSGVAACQSSAGAV